MSEQAHEAGEASTLKGAGARLREARVAMNLSPEDIAARLYLRVTLIHDIENENYERLPPPPFIHGYLRNYAKLVGLSCDQVVDSCESMVDNSMPSISVVSGKEEVTTKNRSVKAVTWFIILVLIALLAIWWVGRQPIDTFSPTVLSEGVEQLQPEPAPFSGNEVEPSSEPEPAAPSNMSGSANDGMRSESEDVTDSAEEATVATDAADVDGPAAEGGEISPAEAAIESPAVESPQETTADVDEAADDGAVVAAAAEAGVEIVDLREDAPSPAAVPATTVVPKSLKAGDAQAELYIEIAEDCWTEVRDDAGRALYFNVAKAGARLTLKGRAPFKLLLGNAAGSKVTLNGEAVSYSGRGVVRLTVGSKDDNRVPGQ